MRQRATKPKIRTIYPADSSPWGFGKKVKFLGHPLENNLKEGDIGTILKTYQKDGITFVRVNFDNGTILTCPQETLGLV